MDFVKDQIIKMYVNVGHKYFPSQIKIKQLIIKLLQVSERNN